MTTVPAIARLFNASRIASTAAWSAAFSSPRPISREAESAAASVTRTASNARLRSIFDVSGMAFLLVFVEGLLFSEIFDADHAGRLEHRVERFDPLQRPAHRRLDGNMGGHHHRYRLAWGAATLDHGFHRHLLIAQRGRDIGDHPRLIHYHQPDVVGAVVPFDRHPGNRAQIGGVEPESRHVAAGSDVDEIGGDRRSRRKRAGTPPLQYDSADEVTFGDHRVVDTLYRGDRRRPRHHARMNALLQTLVGQPRDPEQLDAVAELFGKVDIQPRDVANPLGIDSGEVDRAPETNARQNRQFVRGVDAV